jgi:DNA ligase 1
LKLDGFRLILTKFEDKVRLYTRHNNEVTSKFSELHQVEIPKGMVLDGQIVVTNKQGKPDFEAMMEMMERYMSRRSHHMVQYCVFDVIYYKGKKVTQLLPLVERKELVDAILKPTEAITKVQWMYGRGTDYFNLIKEQGLEGIVLKKADAKYQINKRSND